MWQNQKSHFIAGRTPNTITSRHKKDQFVMHNQISPCVTTIKTAHL
jgi:hypothetical protein